MLFESHSPLPRVDDARVRWRGGWLRFDGLRHWFETKKPTDVSAVLRKVEREVEHGGFAVGFVAFEAAAAFDRAFPILDAEPGLPLVAFGIFESVRNEPSPPLRTAPFDFAVRQVATTRDRGLGQYRRAFTEIRKAIAAGDIYQVNYTFPFTVAATRAEDRPMLARALFEDLCGAQGGRYACELRTESLDVLSASPELFFEVDRGRIIARPMKGTAPRGRFGAEDASLAKALAASTKDRAENVMIVDMMRNDLGRIATVGSVEVPSLFDVERLPTLHQMTSTVTAQTNASLAEVFKALFPCASITGAPKVSALNTIRELESGPRGIYTGAVGMVLPAHPDLLDLTNHSQERPATSLAPAQPRFHRGPTRTKQTYSRFNVAIRTAWRTGHNEAFHYGVGSGVVWDSKATSEHAECRSKALALTAPRPLFQLLETMLVKPCRDPGSSEARALQRIWLFAEHLHRLSNSAEYFGIPLDQSASRSELETALSKEAGRSRLRLLVDQAGAVTLEFSGEPVQTRRVRRIALAADPVDTADPFLFHKTTHRSVYTDALAAARGTAPDLDDVVLWNHRGEVTESTIANLALAPSTAGQPWRTPALESGLLAGTLRQRLLARGRLVEAILTRGDLEQASSIVLLNGVRGLLRAELTT